MRRRRAFFTLLAVVLTTTLSAHAAVAPTDFSKADWRQMSDNDRIQVYRWDVPGSDLLAFKAVARIDAPFAKVGSVLVDIERQKEWMPNLAEARTLHKVGPHERIDYTQIRTPIVIKDRDFVLDAKARFDKATGHLILSVTSTTDPQAPPTNRVRGEVYESSYTLWPIEGGARTQVEFIAHVDPKGSVPKWIVNFFSTGFPREVMEALRKQSAREDIILQPELKELAER